MIWWAGLAVLLLFLLRFWPKGIFLFLAAAAVLGTGVYYWNTLQQQKRSLVQLVVQYAPDSCPSSTPLEVHFINTAPDTVERVLFTVEAHLPGYSTPVVPFSYTPYRSDKILSAGEEFRSCYPAPRFRPNRDTPFAPEELIWTPVVQSVYFQ